MHTPGDMLDGILEENQFLLLGVGHIVIIKIVLKNSLNLIYVCQVLIHTVFFLCTHLQGNIVRYFSFNTEIQHFMD